MPKQVYHALVNGSPLCEYCKGNPFENSIQDVAPEMVKKYWHYERNNALGKFPNKFQFRSNDDIYVKCDKHNWGISEAETRRCADLANKHIPCPKCRGQASPENMT